MNTITITVPGEELENLSIELTSEEVCSLYKLRKQQASKIEELDKKIKDQETMLKYATEGRAEAQNELSQAHTLLSALGITEKTNENESYYQKPLMVSTRIALYIAQLKG
jgi:hypothetical protein